MPYGPTLQRAEHVQLDAADPAEPRYLWLNNSPAPNIVSAVVIRGQWTRWPAASLAGPPRSYGSVKVDHARSPGPEATLVMFSVVKKSNIRDHSRLPQAQAVATTSPCAIRTAM